MKILNLFKKKNKKAIKSNAQKLDKKQLEKVIGGADNRFTGSEVWNQPCG